MSGDNKAVDDSKQAGFAPGKGGNIAISLSGGGVRAVGFHLGMLETLDRLCMLKKVRILSTVSGGSLPGIGYALAQHTGQPFNQYFSNFYKFLPCLNTVEKLLQGLSKRKSSVPSGRRDLITVLANVYDEEYFRKYFPKPGGSDDSPRFGVFWDRADNIHLREMVFNATEFQTGKAFRFQKSDYRNLIGNSSIQLCEYHAKQMRIADIMAASSCIPVGMEPMFFPDDFHWPDRTYQEIKAALAKNLHGKFRLHKDSSVDVFALMDGGVYDNQGLVSLLLALNRVNNGVAKSGDCGECGKSLNDKGDPARPEDWARWLAGESDGEEGNGDLWGKVDLLIISDTPVLKDSMYPKLPAVDTSNRFENPLEQIPSRDAGRRKTRRGGMTVGALDRIGWAVTVLLLASSGTIAYGLVIGRWSDLGSPVDELLAVGIPLLLTMGLVVTLVTIRRRARDVANKLYQLLPERWDKHPWHYLKKLKLADLRDMLHLRLGSGSALITSVFMNRIRSLSYSAAYSRPDLGSHVITNQIFALEQLDYTDCEAWPRDWYDIPISQMSDVAHAIVVLAAHMPTKLWVNEVDKTETKAKTNGLLSDATCKVVHCNDKRQDEGQCPLTEFDVLVICGQLTTCYKLMLHLWRNLRNVEGQWLTDESRRQFDEARSNWNLLQEDPAELLDQRKAGVPAVSAA